jgi:hypothetical protein
MGMTMIVTMIVGVHMIVGAAEVVAVKVGF